MNHEPVDDPATFGLLEADELRRSVGVIVRAVRDRSSDGSDGQIETLGFLMRGGPMSIAALARARGVRHQSMSSVVAELEALGLVVRSPDPADARGVLITLTSEGSSVVTRSREERSTIIRTAAEAALTPEERAILVRVPTIFDALSEALLAGRSTPR